jgi:hypothetical protein
LAGPAATTSVASAWDLVLAGCTADASARDLASIRGLLQGSIQWEEVLRLADHHGTSVLLYRNLSRLSGVAGIVPPATMASLRQFADTNVLKSLVLARELIRIVECLDRLGIKVIPYKGIALSEIYYGDMALRPAGDIDLFVRKGDVGRIKIAVRELGYTTRLAVPPQAEEDYIAQGYEYTFDSPLGKNLLEVKWALQPRFYAVDFDMERMFERAVNATVAGRGMKALSDEDLLLVLSLHAAKHVWGRLIWLCDIAQILRRGNLDWAWVRGQARELGIERILDVTLLLLNHLLGVEIPVIEDRAAQALAQEIGARMAFGVAYDSAQVSYFRLMMRLRERRWDRLRFLARLVFTPGPGEWEAVPLPRLLSPLYRVVRLGRLARKLTR